MESIAQWVDIPTFADSSEESTFWRTHRLNVSLMEQSVVDADQGESTSITIRIDPRMLARLKRLARSRYLNYQSMMKQWLSERLEMELRARGER